MDALFTHLLSLPVDAVDCPTTLNGAGGTVDMKSCSTFVADANMIVVNPDGTFNLMYSMANSIDCAMNSPQQVTVVTVENVRSARKSIACQMYRYGLLDILAHCTSPFVPGLRSADVKSVGEFDAAPNHLACLNAARQIWSLIGASPRARAQIMPNPMLALLSMVAQYLHRHQNEGHAWFTDAKKGTMTHKTLAVAGASVELFTAFQETYGHDLWHILSDESLEDAALRIVGETEVSIKKGYVIYGVALEADTPLSTYLNLPTSATDRVPADIVGMSAIVLFLPLLSSVLDMIAFRFNDFDIEGTQAAITGLESAISEAYLDRVTLVLLRDALAQTVSTCVGIGYTGTATSEYISRHASLVTFANRNTLFVLRGDQIGNALKTVTIDSDKVIESLRLVIATINKTLTAAAKIVAKATAEAYDNEA